MLEAAIEAGADDCDTGAEAHWLTTTIDAFSEVQAELEKKFGPAKSASIGWRPQNTVEVDEEKGEKLLKLIDSLEDSDDVQKVYANFEMSDKVMEKLSA
jgi:transcriptional/translational regulatory protein YebC/TACO1